MSILQKFGVAFLVIVTVLYALSMVSARGPKSMESGGAAPSASALPQAQQRGSEPETGRTDHPSAGSNTSPTSPDPNDAASASAPNKQSASQPDQSDDAPTRENAAQRVVERVLHSILNMDRDWTHVWMPGKTAYLICGLQSWEIRSVTLRGREAGVVFTALISRPGQKWEEVPYFIGLAEANGRFRAVTLRRWLSGGLATGQPRADEYLLIVSGWKEEAPDEVAENQANASALAAACENAILRSDTVRLINLSRQALREGAFTVAARIHQHVVLPDGNNP